MVLLEPEAGGPGVALVAPLADWLQVHLEGEGVMNAWFLNTQTQLFGRKKKLLQQKQSNVEFFTARSSCGLVLYNDGFLHNRTD